MNRWASEQLGKLNTVQMRKVANGRLVRWGFGLITLAVIAWLLARELDWQAVQQALASANYRWVLVAVLAIVGTFFSRAWRWQALLYRSTARLRPVMTALLVGQAANLVVPMQGGHVVRAMWIGPERDVGASEALGSIAIEKVWDLLALVVCGLLLLAWGPQTPWFQQSTWGTALVFVLGVAVLWAGLHWQATLFAWLRKLLTWLPDAWVAALVPRLQGIAQGLEAIRQPKSSAWALLWTVATWGLGMAANWAVMAAFGIHSIGAAIFLQAALMLGGAAVPTPGQLGVFEGVCVVALGLFGVSSDRALAVGLVLHLVVMGPPLIAAGLLILWSRLQRGELESE